MLNHIWDIQTSIKEVSVIEKISFSNDVKKVVVFMSKGLLSELYSVSSEYKDFALIYKKIVETMNCFNEESYVSVNIIKNAIRILDLRMRICKSNFESKKDNYSIIEENACTMDNNILNENEKFGRLWVNVKDVEFKIEFYNEVTMRLMEKTREILVNSLISLTSDFE